MQKFEIAPTDYTPHVVLDTENRLLLIKGVCVPENAKVFFVPIFEALKKYKLQETQLKIEIHFNYFNTSTSKNILDMLLFIIDKDSKKVECSVDWLVESGDEDLLESGHVFEELTGIKFNYINV